MNASSSSRAISQRPWQSLHAQDVVRQLDSSDKGLSSAAAHARLQESGPNRIERGRGHPWPRILLHQIANPIVYVLLGAGLLAMVMGKVADGFVVLAVVVLNTLIGFVQELRASHAIAALTRMVPQRATVLRDGEPVDVSAEEIVPGDVLVLQSGDQVAADVRLLEVNALQVDEAILTGESMPVSKQEAPVDDDALLGDRHSMAFGGTLVTAGTAEGVVVATGTRSELGRISRLLSETDELQTPLTRRLSRLAGAITISILIVAGLVFLVGLLRDNSMLDSALAAITLAVAAVPEGLPAVITIASAIGVRRIARRRAIIRHLSAVETLGSTTVICTDKTGTLTRNEMTVEALWLQSGEIEVTGIGYAPVGDLRRDGEPLKPLPDDVRHLLVAGMLCNDARLECEEGRWRVAGDPTEGALIVAARKGSLEEAEAERTCPRIDEIPFSSERQFMATLHDAGNGRFMVYLKGAPEVIANLCHVFDDGRPMCVQSVHEASNSIANRGMRVLAMATATIHAPISSLKGSNWRDQLRFLGIVGMTDPPREESVEAIRVCRDAGIIVKMVTGDHAETARSIGRQIGLLEAGDHDEAVVTGRQIEAASDARLSDLARAANVFARVTPEHKLRLVTVLQADGHVVAMTGDGVNDAPALKRADIGVAMGIGGTAVAREASDMVLADDNFAAIGAAVEEGRRVYDNLAKSLAFILPTSLGQTMIILVSVLFFPVTDGHLLMPIQPVQILWVNLVVAVALALPLAFETQEPGLMSRPPRSPEEPLLGAFLVFRTFLVGALMTGGAVALFLLEYQAYLRAGAPADQALAHAQTIAVTTIILFQMLYLLNCRSLTQGFWRVGVLSNQWVYWGIVATLALHVAFVYLDQFNRLFHTHPLDLDDWMGPFAFALAGFFAIAFEKWIWRLRQANGAPPA